MTGPDLYRTQVALVLIPLATLLGFSVHGLLFAKSGGQYCIDFAIIVMSTLVIIYAYDLARGFRELVLRIQGPERAPPALK